MKAESNLQPVTAFEINDLPDGTSEVLFYENVEPIPDEEQEKYVYDMYILNEWYRKRFTENSTGCALYVRAFYNNTTWTPWTLK